MADTAGDMRDRRSAERQQVDAHLDDLQSELEAGSRMLEKVQDAASLLATQLEHAALCGTLLREIRTLRKSIAQQRATLRELRGKMRRLRAQAARSRGAS